jgi:pyrimidine dimer DNA glycosylase
VRLWTLHPKYLDARGLVALWREALLAKRVLQGRTRGYRQHPQLDRFRSHPNPIAAIDFYLSAVYDEAQRRGYSFDSTKIAARDRPRRLAETSGQLLHEWQHLLSKLRRRAPNQHRELERIVLPDAHPFFRLVAGGIRKWERAPRRRAQRNLRSSGTRSPDSMK